MLELTAAQSANGSPGTADGFAPPVAYAGSAAFDRDEDAAPLSAIAPLMAIAHTPRLSTSATCPSPTPPQCRV